MKVHPLTRIRAAVMAAAFVLLWWPARAQVQRAPVCVGGFTYVNGKGSPGNVPAPIVVRTVMATSNGADVTWGALIDGESVAMAKVLSIRTGDLVTADIGVIPATTLSFYQFTATNGGGIGTSPTCKIELIENYPALPPGFVLLPQSLVGSAVAGQSVSFEVRPTATKGAPAFQWYKNLALVPGATATRLTLPSVTDDDAGVYSLVAISEEPGPGAAGPSVLTLQYDIELKVSRALPTVTLQPVSQTIGLGASGTLKVAATSEKGAYYQWYKDSAAVSGATDATLVLANATAATAGAYFAVLSAERGPVGFSPAVVSDTAIITVPLPAGIATPPASASAKIGAAASFSVVATGTAPLSYQWSKNGQVIANATSATLSFAAVAASDAAAYTVKVTNATGSITSPPVTLTITAIAPVIATPPVSQTPHLGETVVLTVAAAGSDPLRYQWYKDTVPIVGATSATLRLDRIELSAAGAYFARVRSDFGSVDSGAATLIIANPARVINFSLLTALPADDSFTLGFVTGGAGTAGPKPLLVRAVGPSLTPFGVSNALADPKLEFYAGSSKLAENDNWATDSGSSSTLFTALGAFPLVAPTSKDASLSTSALPGNNSVRISGAPGTAGTVLGELYETTPAASVTSSTPRLINVSVLKKLGDGLTAGFVIGGIGQKTVLIRVIGPSLAQFGVNDFVSDPAVRLRDASGGLIRSNDNWLLADESSMLAVGAFQLARGAKDAALVETLAAGAYTMDVSAIGENAAGRVLVEVYEIP